MMMWEVFFSQIPGLHRAPYSAGEDTEPVRLLINVDRIPQDELQQFIDMDFGEGQLSLLSVGSCYMLLLPG